MTKSKTILIVGALRGLGLGLVRAYLDAGWSVIATSRGNDAPLRDLAASAGSKLQLETLDVTDAAGLAALKQKLAGTMLDVLFVSAGVLGERDAAAADVAADEFARVLVTNALAPLKIIEALGERVAHDGAIVAMTSTLGSVSGNSSGGTEVYRASKAALNTLLRSHAARHPRARSRSDAPGAGCAPIWAARGPRCRWRRARPACWRRSPRGPAGRAACSSTTAGRPSPW